MALVTGQALRVRRDIPHEPGQWVEIRPLSWKRLDEAKRARAMAQAAMIREIGGDVYRELQALRSAGGAEGGDAPPAAASNGHLDPDDFDRGMVLRAGVLAWSYSDPVKAGDTDLLDETTAAWLACEILNLHDRSEEARKND